MYELGLVAPYWVIVLIWLAKVILLALISTLLAWLGIRVLDALTPRIHQRQRIGENPVATTYTSATNVLLVSALDASKTHTISVNYYAETESDVMRVIGPFLGILIFGGLLFALAFGAFSKGHRR